MKRIAVIGAGGHAKVVISTLRAAGFQPMAIFDDNVARHGCRLLDVPIMGDISIVDPSQFDGAVIAVGDNRARQKLAAKLQLPWITVIHPRSWLDSSVRVGDGTVVFAGAIIQPDTVIGQHVIINTGATVDHDCVIGDFAHLAPGVQLAGDVRVGTGSFLGIGSVAIPGIRIGDGAVIGAGSVLIRAVEDGSIAYGNPARPRNT